MREEQINYVVAQLQAGQDRDAVSAVLTKYGYTRDQVTELFLQADRRLA